MNLIIFIPKGQPNDDGDGLASVESLWNAMNSVELLKGMKYQRTLLSLPRFNVSSTLLSTIQFLQAVRNY